MPSPSDILRQHSRDGAVVALRIYTLGRFTVQPPGFHGARGDTGSNPQVRDLLKCLLAAPGYQLTGEQIIEALWPERDPEWAHERLRDTLSKLRRVLEPDRPAYARSAYLVNDRQMIGLVVAQHEKDAAGAWVDCAHFERLTEVSLAAPALEGDARTMAEAALSLYAGPFLPYDRYSDWIEGPRQRYHRLWAGLVRRLARTEIGDRHYERAIRLVSRLTEAVPDDEEAIALSMLAHVGARQRSEALRIYQALCRHLRQTLAVEPTAMLAELGAAFRRGLSADELLARFF